MDVAAEAVESMEEVVKLVEDTVIATAEEWAEVATPEDPVEEATMEVILGMEVAPLEEALTEVEECAGVLLVDVEMTEPPPTTCPRKPGPLAALAQVE